MQELCSDLLFARPTFLRGFCRVGDLFGRFDIYNQSLSDAEADDLALASDWHMIGIDMCKAQKTFLEELE